MECQVGSGGFRCRDACVSDPGPGWCKRLNATLRLFRYPGPRPIDRLVRIRPGSSRFVFVGFAPPKGRKRDDFITGMAQEKYTVVFFESPHRLSKTLADLEKHGLGERRLTIARELTKEYEEFLYLDVMSALRYYETVEPRGEFTLVLEGIKAFERRTDTQLEDQSDEALKDLLHQLLSEGCGPSRQPKYCHRPVV